MKKAYLVISIFIGVSNGRGASTKEADLPEDALFWGRSLLRGVASFSLGSMQGSMTMMPESPPTSVIPTISPPSLRPSPTITVPTPEPNLPPSPSPSNAFAVELIKAINPNDTSSGSFPGLPFFPNDYTYESVNGQVYFNANDGVSGHELWVTNGTEKGTRLVKDIWPGRIGSTPRWLTQLNGKLIFTATTAEYGDELWSSDGTEGGTQLVKDINPGSPASSNPSNLKELNGILIFKAQGLRQIWRTDGTEDGTQLVRNDIIVNGGFSDEYKGNLVFFGRESGEGSGDGMWATNGTDAGTYRISNTPKFPFGAFTEFEGRLFFANQADSPIGVELWVTDLTEAGTKVFKDIRPGPDSSNPDFLTVFNGKLFFGADDGVSGQELWVSDGTVDGTKLFKDISRGRGSSEPECFTEVNGKLFFWASREPAGRELWVTDGTENGTRRVADINRGFLGSAPFVSSGRCDLIEYNDRLIFAADDGIHGNEVWVSDGSEAGTQLIEDIREGPASSRGPSSFFFTKNKGELVFTAGGVGAGLEPWRLYEK